MFESIELETTSMRELNMGLESRTDVYYSYKTDRAP